MGPHKKRRPKKKKNKTTEKIVLSFDTKKKGISDIFGAKYKLFELASLEEIEAALEYHNMPVNRETILNEYEQCFKIEVLLNKYHQQYNQQLDILSSKFLIFDDDCFILYFEKLIRTHYKTWQLPDPDFVFDEFNALENKRTWEQFIIYLEMVKSINKMKEYNTTNDLNAIFEQSYWDIEMVLRDILMNARNIALDFIHETEKIVEFSNEVFSLIDTYRLKRPDYLYGDACDLLGVLGYKAVQDKYLEGIVRFPNYQIGLHNIALFITLFESNHTHEYQEFINIYEKAIHAIPTDEEEIEKQELIKENFEKEYLDVQKLMKG